MIGSDPKHPTITIYNHLDVQPAGGPEWQREPFRMTIDGDRYYARGATDDKGPALTALYAARYAVENGVPINVRFLWELEEEIGSPNFESFLSQAASDVPTQSVLVSDTIWVKRGKPAVSAGLRGLQSATLTLETGSKDTHSGLTGGAARNPLTELAAVIAACVDAKSGKVKIPGFYDAVIKPTKEELAHFKASGFSVSAFTPSFDRFAVERPKRGLTNERGPSLETPAPLKPAVTLATGPRARHDSRPWPPASRTHGAASAACNGAPPLKNAVELGCLHETYQRIAASVRNEREAGGQGRLSCRVRGPIGDGVGWSARL
jgi:hypothetical protein